jgi:hypothetical protein
MTTKREQYLKDYDSKRKRVSISFTEKEYQELQNISKKFGDNPTTFLKNIYLSSKENEKILTKDTSDELKKLKFLIRNIANNINQIAKNNNIIGSLFNSKKANKKLIELETVINDFVNKKD